MFLFFWLSKPFAEQVIFGDVLLQTQTRVVDGMVADVSEASSSCAQRLSSSTLRNSNSGPVFVVSKYGTKQLILKQHTFNRHVSREEVTYWRCSQFAVLRCRARIKTKGNILTVLNSEHNHEVITQARKYGSLKTLKAEQNAKKDLKEKSDLNHDKS